jgi:putative transposase
MPIRKKVKMPGPGLAFVTTTVVDWTPIFKLESAALIVIRELDKTLKLHGGSLAGYVLMPSHVHLLVGLPEISNLSKFIQTFKSMSSRRIKKIDLPDYRDIFYQDGKFRLWKPRFDDLIINSEKQFRIKLEYIHNNPVKAGLVDNPMEWIYSSAVDWTTNREGMLVIDKSFKWLAEV